MLDDMNIDHNYLPLPERQTSSETFNVVIAYDEATAAERAMRLFTELSHEFGSDLRFRAYLWRFDLLGNPACDQFTLADGIRAHLLIISTSSDSELPIGVQRWVSGCLAGRSDRVRAIIALFGEQGHVERDDSPRLAFLREDAHKCDLDFLEPSEMCDRPFLATPLHRESHAASVTRLIEQIVHPFSQPVLTRSALSVSAAKPTFTGTTHD
jgi:hypothetical protein